MKSVKVFCSFEGLPSEFPGADGYTVTDRGHLVIYMGDKVVASFSDGIWAAVQILDEPAK